MSIKLEVFGTGCQKCNQLTEVVEGVAKAMELNYSLEKISDIAQIVKRGVLSTPALAINGQIVSKGRIPSQDELKDWLTGVV